MLGLYPSSLYTAANSKSLYLKQQRDFEHFQHLLYNHLEIMFFKIRFRVVFFFNEKPSDCVCSTDLHLKMSSSIASGILPVFHSKNSGRIACLIFVCTSVLV